MTDMLTIALRGGEAWHVNADYRDVTAWLKNNDLKSEAWRDFDRAGFEHTMRQTPVLIRRRDVTSVSIAAFAADRKEAKAA